MSEATGSQSKPQKFKQTRELVRLALNAGWTQQEIADACRVGQSTVSAWKDGKSKAKEHQLEKLLEAFGHKLRRMTFAVYWYLDDASDRSPLQFFRVEGRVIMDHAFHDSRRHVKTGKLIKTISRRRLIVHDQGSDQYLLLKQKRIRLANSEDVVECSIPEASWSTEVVNSATMSKKELIDYIDAEHLELLETSPSDAATLPYLIRRALLYAGEPVDGVVDYPAQA